MITDCTIIIRSVGERTTEFCKYLLAQQVPIDNMFTCYEVPFSASMRKSFEVGIEQNRKYTLCIDADVMVTSNAVEILINHAENQDENVCEVQAQVLDKFTGKARAAGNHLYRTSLLPEVLKRIPDEGINIRPEYYTLCKMKNDGYPWVEFSDVIGLHDYEQYYRDIFRKTYVYAFKLTNLLESLLAEWRAKSNKDMDYQVALWGLAAGISSKTEARIDASNIPVNYLDFYSNHALKEKDFFLYKEADIDTKHIIDEYFQGGGDYLDNKYNVKARDINVTKKQEVAKTYRKPGRLRAAIFLLSIFLNKVSYKLKIWATSVDR